jgi:cell division protein ZapA (FtsZ GTPase activity inhibitor)
MNKHQRHVEIGNIAAKVSSKLDELSEQYSLSKTEQAVVLSTIMHMMVLGSMNEEWEKKTDV